MRELIGFHELLNEVCYIVFKSSKLYTEYYTISKMFVTITQWMFHEDNRKRLKFYAVPNIYPWTKYISINTHFFQTNIEHPDIKVVTVSNYN